MRFFALIIVAMTSLLAGCNATTNPFISQQGSSTAYMEAQRPERVVLGTIISVRRVRLIDQPASVAQRTGAVVGGVLGLVVGKGVSRQPTVQALMAGLSGAIGAEVGKQAAGTVWGQELVVKPEQGEVFAVAQSSVDGVRFKRGQKVMVLGSGRVAPLE